MVLLWADPDKGQFPRMASLKGHHREPARLHILVDGSSIPEMLLGIPAATNRQSHQNVTLANEGTTYPGQLAY